MWYRWLRGDIYLHTATTFHCTLHTYTPDTYSSGKTFTCWNLFVCFSLKLRRFDDNKVSQLFFLTEIVNCLDTFVYFLSKFSLKKLLIFSCSSFVLFSVDVVVVLFVAVGLFTLLLLLLWLLLLLSRFVLFLKKKISSAAACCRLLQIYTFFRKCYNLLKTFNSSQSQLLSISLTLNSYFKYFISVHNFN